jgi:hypothetical protein
LIILLIPSSAVYASPLNVTRINISLSDAEGQPLSDVQISLDLYFYEVIAPEQAELRGAISDACTTDAHGVCTILIGETQDLLLHGKLDLGNYGSRELEWYGGELDVPIQLKQESKAQFKPMTMYSAILFALIALGVIVQHRRKNT